VRTKRQAYAYDHPLTRADDLALMNGLRVEHEDGELRLRTILAVDR
jgi:hypothetical protein